MFITKDEFNAALRSIDAGIAKLVRGRKILKPFILQVTPQDKYSLPWSKDALTVFRMKFLRSKSAWICPDFHPGKHKFKCARAASPFSEEEKIYNARKLGVTCKAWEDSDAYEKRKSAFDSALQANGYVNTSEKDMKHCSRKWLRIFLLEILRCQKVRLPDTTKDVIIKALLQWNSRVYQEVLMQHPDVFSHGGEGRHPWEMTRREHELLAQPDNFDPQLRIRVPYEGAPKFKTIKHARVWLSGEHRRRVKWAVEHGKYVPGEVRAGYRHEAFKRPMPKRAVCGPCMDKFPKLLSPPVGASTTIEFIKNGDILLAEGRVGALVVPVNCQGIAGAGLALQFREKFKSNFRLYRERCLRMLVEPGEVLSFTYADAGRKSLTIFNFPTKDDYRKASQYRWIRGGLASLIGEMRRLQIHSVAIPALGCGLGGLQWGVVKALIQEAFAHTQGMKVLCFEPYQ